MEVLSCFKHFAIIQVICTQHLKLISFIYLSFLFIYEILHRLLAGYHNLMDG